MTTPVGVVDSCSGNLGGASAQVFLALINTLFASKCTINEPNEYPSDFSSSLYDGDEFDFIIVGAGSAGCVVANRLSENSNWRVLLIEAGTTPSSTSEIPLLNSALKKTAEDWQYVTEPASDSCLGFVNARCLYPRGKVLGGSSTLNGMVYIRGQRQDYDQWAAAGNNGWDWDSVYPYFLKSESLRSEVPTNGTAYGTEGFQAISFADIDVPFVKAAIAAGAELGLPYVVGEADIGLFHVPQTVYHGLRANTAKEFLGTIQQRSNLKVAKYTLATNIIINDLKAQGVTVSTGERTIRIFAKNEVILSGGAINSPQLLLLSGIGPQKHLTDLGIPTKLDLHVGNNFQDHLAFLGLQVKISEELAPKINLNDELYRFLAHREGYFTSNPLYTFQGLINLDKSTHRDIQIHHFPHSINDNTAAQGLLTLGVDPSIANRLKAINSESALVTLTTFLLHPVSRGFLRLNSTDPTDKPKITTGFLSEKQDVDTLLQGIRYLQRYLETNTFRKFKAEVVDLKIPGCSNYQFDSDDYWICYLRYLTIPGYHPVGTCKMGPKTDPTAVVDERLRVHGVEKLRVVDASIMPTLPGCNTNAPSIMVGQRGAALILEDWKISDK